MKYFVIYTFVILFAASCNCDVSDTNNKELKPTNSVDTLYSDDVLGEYAGQFTDYKSTLSFDYLDKNNNRIKGLHSNDTIRLRVFYYSQKFPELNEDYVINLYPVTKNFSYQQLSRNKFELFIDSTADMIEFDLDLSCKGVIFKYGELDKENNLTYVPKGEVGLSRFYEPITHVSK